MCWKTRIGSEESDQPAEGCFGQRLLALGRGSDTNGRLILEVSVLMRKFTVVAPNWESPFTSCRVFDLRNWQWAWHCWSQLMCRGTGWEAAFEIMACYHQCITAQHSVPAATASSGQQAGRYKIKEQHLLFYFITWQRHTFLLAEMRKNQCSNWTVPK